MVDPPEILASMIDKINSQGLKMFFDNKNENVTETLLKRENKCYNQAD